MSDRRKEGETGLTDRQDEKLGELQQGPSLGMGAEGQLSRPAAYLDN